MRPSTRKPKPRPSACRLRIFGARTRRSSRSASRNSRAIDVPSPSYAFLDWPFFAPEHRALATSLSAWAGKRFANAAHAEDRASVDATCRQLVKDLGAAGWTRHSAHLRADGETVEFDVRTL